MVDTSLAGIAVSNLEQLTIRDNLITTIGNLEAMEELSTLFVSDVIRDTSTDVLSVKLTLKSGDSNAEGERIGIGFVHALSMAHNRSVWGRWWTLIALACSTNELRHH